MDVYDEDHHRAAEKDYEIFHRFDDPRRFKIIDIRPLDLIALEGLAAEMCGSSISDAEINRIHDASGGNPLYAVELMKAMTGNQGFWSASSSADVDGNAVCRRGSLSHISTKIDTKTKVEMNHRVEEIICFRLDKLSSPLQTVLKAAAVAASNGKAFDAVVISFILQEHDYFAEERSKEIGNFGTSCAFDEDSYLGNNMMQVEEAFEELASHGDFIRFVVENDDDDDNNFGGVEYSKLGEHHRRAALSGNVNEAESSGMFMEFKIPVEQATIYGLIVDEQKEYFHERVALFCIRQMSLTTSSKRDDAYMIEEEAFHWEHSSLWSRALSAYVNLAEIERGIGNERAWLQCIYRAAKMYKFMEEETCSLFPFEESVLRDESLVLSIIKNKGEVPSHIAESIVGCLERELDAVYDVFAVDMLVIPKVARLRRFGQYSIV